MRAALALLMAVTAGPALAQASVGPPPSAAATDAFASSQRETARFSFEDGREFRGQLSSGESLRRAGAWGECVIAGDPNASRSYLASMQSTQRLRWTFDRCRRKVGDFAYSGSGAIRRAAILDALHTPAG